jgi:hypothetical protein
MKHLLPKLKNLGALPALITLLLLPGLGWGLTAGDIAIIAVNSDDPDAITFVALEDITAGTVITFTDNAWTTANGPFTANEGYVEWTCPAGGISKGTVTNMTSVGTMAIAAAGDQVIAFTGTWANRPISPSDTKFLYAFSLENFITTGTTTSNTSYLPSALLGASVAMTTSATETDNAYFANGSTTQTAVSVSGTKAELLALFNDASKYYKNDTGPLTLPTYTITVNSGSTPTVATPNPTSLSGFSTVTGTASTAQTFTISGTNLTADLVVTAPTDYEVRENETGSYGSSVSFTPSLGTVSEKTIQVRVAASAGVGTPSGNVVCSSEGATSQNVSVSGTVSAPPTPTITVDPSTLLGFTYAVGSGPSAEKSFTVSGISLTADLIVTPPADYEISTGTGGSFTATNPIGLTPSSGTVAATTIYVRLKSGLSTGSYNAQNISAASTGATTQNVVCSGTVTPALWMHMLTTGAPAATRMLGDKLNAGGDWYINFEIGQSSWYQSDAGIGQSNTDPSAWTWETANFYEDGSGSNKRVRTNFGEFQFTATGNWYFNGRAKSAEGDPFNYANSDQWQNATSFSPVYYFTVNALSDPSDQDATAASSSQIDLSWAADASAHQVMIVRKLSSASWTEPTQGTSYSVDDVIGSGTVVYKGFGTSFGNTGLSANTTYDYKFYSENYNYYSAGVTAQATTLLPDIIINEVDADTPGTDVAEFIELYDGGIGNSSLNGFVVVLFNGSTDVSYAAYDLDGYSTNASGYFLLGNEGVTGVSITFANNFLQNGQDAVALYYSDASAFPNGTAVTTSNLIDAFVYDTDDADDPGLLSLLNAGQPQVNENGRGSMASHSSQRLPNGSGGARNTSTYDQTLPTPGAANTYADISWTGTTDTDWAVATNWNPNYIPDIVSNAIIPDVTNDPVISGTAVCKDLTIAASAIVEIAATGSLTVDGTLSNSGSLNIKSTATNTGSLIHSTSGVPATVERFITAATWETAGSGWHLLSSPVAAQSISGDWTPTGAGNDYDFYAFDETATTEYWLNQKVGANNITAFIPGKGYLVAYQQTDTKTFSGNLNVADVTLSGLTNTGTSAYPGWHLAGNPFASAINWGSGTWTKTNINAVAQVWSSADGSYKTTTEQSDIIPAMNGFMVYTTGSGELTIPADAREHNAANWYKSDEEFILLKANDLEGLTSQSSIVRFNPSATEAYDADFDAYFLAGFAPMFYSVSGSSLYALNTLPAVSNELAIPFGFVKNTATNYNIELAKNIPATIVYLTDIKTGTVTNLTDEGAYHFTAAEGDDANRFTLHFGTLGMDDPSTTAPVNIYAYGGVVYLNGPDAKASVTITDLTGRVVMAERVNGNGLSMLNAAKLPKGVYVVTAVAGSRVVSAKVIL